ADGVVVGRSAGFERCHCHRSFAWSAGRGRRRNLTERLAVVTAPFAVAHENPGAALGGEERGDHPAAEQLAYHAVPPNDRAGLPENRCIVDELDVRLLLSII